MKQINPRKLQSDKVVETCRTRCRKLFIRLLEAAKTLQDKDLSFVPLGFVPLELRPRTMERSPEFGDLGPKTQAYKL